MRRRLTAFILSILMICSCVAPTTLADSSAGTGDYKAPVILRNSADHTGFTQVEVSKGTGVNLPNDTYFVMLVCQKENGLPAFAFDFFSTGTSQISSWQFNYWNDNEYKYTLDYEFYYRPLYAYVGKITNGSGDSSAINRAMQTAGFSNGILSNVGSSITLYSDGSVIDESGNTVYIDFDENNPKTIKIHVGKRQKVKVTVNYTGNNALALSDTYYLVVGNHNNNPAIAYKMEELTSSTAVGDHSFEFDIIPAEGMYVLLKRYQSGEDTSTWGGKDDKEVVWNDIPGPVEIENGKYTVTWSGPVVGDDGTLSYTIVIQEQSTTPVVNTHTVIVSAPSSFSFANLYAVIWQSTDNNGERAFDCISLSQNGTYYSSDQFTGEWSNTYPYDSSRITDVKLVTMTPQNPASIQAWEVNQAQNYTSDEYDVDISTTGSSTTITISKSSPVFYKTAIRFYEERATSTSTYTIPAGSTYTLTASDGTDTYTATLTGSTEELSFTKNEEADPVTEIPEISSWTLKKGDAEVSDIEGYEISVTPTEEDGADSKHKTYVFSARKPDTYSVTVEAYDNTGTKENSVTLQGTYTLTATTAVGDYTGTLAVQDNVPMTGSKSYLPQVTEFKITDGSQEVTKVEGYTVSYPTDMNPADGKYVIQLKKPRQCTASITYTDGTTLPAGYDYYIVAFNGDTVLGYYKLTGQSEDTISFAAFTRADPVIDEETTFKVVRVDTGKEVTQDNLTGAAEQASSGEKLGEEKFRWEKVTDGEHAPNYAFTVSRSTLPEGTVREVKINLYSYDGETRVNDNSSDPDNRENLTGKKLVVVARLENIGEPDSKKKVIGYQVQEIEPDGSGYYDEIYFGSVFRGTCYKEYDWGAQYENADDVSYNENTHDISIRLYEIPSSQSVNGWQYGNLVNLNDTITGYSFKAPPNGNVTSASGDTTTLNLEKSYPLKYQVKLELPDDVTVTEDDDVCLKVEVKHATGDPDIYFGKVVGSGPEIYVVLEDQSKDPVEKHWTSGGSGLLTGNEEYTVTIITGSGGRIDSQAQSAVEEGGTAAACTVSYTKERTEEPDPAARANIITDYITFTKIEATNDTNYMAILGQGINFAITAERFEQENHIQANFAANNYKSAPQPIEPDLNASATGSVIIAHLDTSGSNEVQIGQKTPGTLLVYVDSQQLDDGEIEFKDDSQKAVLIPSSGSNLSSTIVEPIISHMETVSAQLNQPATIKVSKPMGDGQRLVIDTRHFDDDATIYINADEITDYLSGADKVRILKKDNQTIVFNFNTTETVDIGQFLCLVEGEEINSSSPVDSTDPKNGKVDKVAQRIVWNCVNCKTVNVTNSTGIFLLPRDDSTFDIKGTSSGWIISDGKVVNSGGEWHGVYRNLTSYEKATLHARKTIETKSPKTSERFVFQVFRYDTTEKKFKPIVIDDHGTELTAENNGEAISFTIDQANYQLGWNVYMIQELRVADSTAATGKSYTTDQHVYYAEFEVTEKAGTNLTVTVPGLPSYYSQFDTSTERCVPESVITGSPTFDNQIVRSGLSVHKAVEGTDAPDALFSFKIELWEEIVVTEENKATDPRLANYTVNDTVIIPKTGSVSVSGISGLESLTFTENTTTHHGEASIKLHQNETLTLNLEPGIHYCVTETASQTGESADEVPFNDTNQSNGYTRSFYGVTGVMQDGQPATANFTNSYEATGQVDFMAKKVFTHGTISESKPFTIRLTQVHENNSFVQASAEAGDTVVLSAPEEKEIKDPADPYAVFDAITFTKKQAKDETGEYWFLIEEVLPANTPESGISGGIQYDTRKTWIKVTVEDNGNGTLKVTKDPLATKEDGKNTDLDVTFTNEQLGSVKVTKAFSGVASLPSDFKITASYKDANNQDVTTELTISDGQTRTGSGTETDPYVYTWTIEDLPIGREVQFTETGITVDGYTVSVTVNETAKGTVTEATGTAVAALDPTTSGATASFVNTYTRDTGSLRILKKTTINDEVRTDTTLVDGIYEFTVQSDAGVTPATTKTVNITIVNGVVTAATVDDVDALEEVTDGTTTTKYAKVTDLPTGSYTVTENTTGLAARHITLAEQPTTSILVTKDQTSGIPVATFRNNYEAGELEVSKTVEGTSDKTKVFYFKVTLTDGTAPLSGTYPVEVTATGDQETQFAENKITFVNGVATFTLKADEKVLIKDLPSGISYTVEETGTLPTGYEKTKPAGVDNGTIGVNTTEKSEFINSYTNQTTSVVFGGKKTIKGTDSTDTRFTFELYQTTDDTFTIAQGDDPIDTFTTTDTIGTAGATYSFDAITYDDSFVSAPGPKYYYVIKENQTSISGWTLSTVEYHATVVISYDSTNKLVSSVTCTKVEGTAQPVTVQNNALDFENTYEATGDVQFRAKKIFTNGTISNDQPFKIRLTQVKENGSTEQASTESGNKVILGSYVEQTINSDTSPYAAFDAITFTKNSTTDQTGEYWFLIEEVPQGTLTDGILNGVRYDTTRHWIKVTVEDHEDGTLTVTKSPLATKEGNTDLDVTFTNEQLGKLTLKKDLVKPTGATIPTNYTFNVKGEDGKFYGENGTVGNTAIAITVSSTNANGVTLENLPIQKYTVTEVTGDNNAAIAVDGYSVVVEYNNQDVTITKDGTTVTVRNTYTRDTGKLKIDKTVTVNGSKPSDYSLVDGTYSFRIKSEAGVVPETNRIFTITISNGEPTAPTFEAAPDGTDGQAAIALENGEVVITGLPTGQYTVTEELTAAQIADGISLTQKPETSILIVKYEEGTTQIETATFTNNREVGDLEISKTVEGTTDKTVPFTFTVTLTAPDGVTLKDKYPIITTSAVMTANSGVLSHNSTSGKDEISISNGTVTFTLKAGESLLIKDLPSGTTYKVSEAAPPAGYTQTNPAGDYEGSISRECSVAAFENTYTLQTTSVTFGGKKMISGIDSTERVFSFELYETDSSYSIEGKTPLQTVSTSGTISSTGGKSYNFEAITYSKSNIGDHYYVIVEKALDQQGGWTISTSRYKEHVHVYDGGNGVLMRTVTGIPEPDQLNFTNIYHATGSLNLTATKALTGFTLADGQFSFTLTGNGQNQEKGNVGENITFDTISFDEKDIGHTYTYTVKEVIPDPVPKGYTYDQSEYEVKVTITVDPTNDANLIATPVIKKVVDSDGKPIPAAGQTTISTMSFSNKYEASGSLNLTATKAAQGFTLEDGQFGFTLTGGSQNQSKKNIGNTVTFDEITYNQNDLNTTFTYTVKEEVPDTVPAGYTYDRSEYQVTVTLAVDSADGSHLIATPVIKKVRDKKGDSISEGSQTEISTMSFSNEYEATGYVTFKAKKTFTNGTISDTQSFTIRLTQVDADQSETKVTSSILSTNPTEVIINDPNHPTAEFGVGENDTHTIVFTRNKTTDQTGEYWFLLEEAVPANLPTNNIDSTTLIRYDTNKVWIKVTVTDQGDGTLKVEKSTSGDLDVTFTNEQLGKLILKKDLVKPEGANTIPTSFTFNVQGEDGKFYGTNGEASNTAIAITVSSVATGGVTLVNLPIQEYTVTEVTGKNNADIAVAGYSVTVDNSGCKVTAAKDGGDGATATIKNTYTRDKGNLIVRKTVTVNGDTPADYSLVDGTYQFLIKSEDGVVPATERYFTITISNGTATTAGFGNATTGTDTSATISVESGVVTICDLPTGKYTVTEELTAEQQATGIHLTNEPSGPIEVVKYTGSDTSIRTAAFTNNRDVGDLTVGKTVAGDPPSNESFDLTVTLTAPSGISLASVYPVETSDAVINANSTVITQVGTSGKYEIHFAGNQVTFRLSGGEHLKIKNLPKGTTYTVSEGVLPSGYQQTSPSGNATGEISSTPSEAAFVNTYSATDTSITFGGKKMIQGIDSTDTVFTFELYETDDENYNITGKQPIRTKLTTGTITRTAGQVYNFDAITYSTSHAGDLGDHYYVIIEKALDPAGGWTISDTTYHEHVLVKDGGGALVCEIVDADSDAAADQLNFTNTYAAIGSITLTATKAAYGFTLADEQFSFTLSGGNLTETQTKKNYNGKVTFDQIGYTEADIGRTYTYTVKEVVPDPVPKGYTYDRSEYEVAVTITVDPTNSSNLVATPEIKKVVDKNGNPIASSGQTTVQTMSFNNSYQANGSVVLTAAKKAKGFTLADNTFGFSLTGEGQNQTVGNIGETVTFNAITYTQADIGETFVYTVKEIQPATIPAGYTYDQSEYQVTVTVGVDSSDSSKLDPVVVTKQVKTASGVAIPENAQTPITTPMITFTNNYQATGNVTFKAKKVFTNGTITDTQSFTVRLKQVTGDGSEEEATAAAGYKVVLASPVEKTISSNSDPTALFGKVAGETISFTRNGEKDQTGEYWFMLEEVPGGTLTDGIYNGVRYDTNKIWIKVTVTDQGDGTLKVEKSTSGDLDATFTNEQLGKLTLKKDLVKPTGATIPTNYTFNVKGKDGKFYGENGAVSNTAIAITVSSEAAEGITLENLPIQEYTVTEVTGDNNAALAVDGYSVTVENNNQNVTITKDGKTVTVRNTYTRDTGKLTIRKTVTVNGSGTISDTSLVDGEYFFRIQRPATGDDPAIDRKVRITISGGNATGAEFVLGENETNTNPELTISFDATNKEAVIGGLPTGDYTVTEELTSEQTGKGIKLTDEPSGKLTVVKDEQGATIPTAAFTNNREISDLEITKTVSGTSDKTQDFTFEVTLTPPAGVTVDGTYTAVKTDKDGNPASTTVTVSGGKIEGITLKADEKFLIKGLPGGTAYTVRETTLPDGYELIGSDGSSDTLGREKKTAAFRNQFKLGTTSVTFGGKKTIQGTASTEQVFTFELYQTDASFNTNGKTPVLAYTTGTVTGEQSYSFDPITYTSQNDNGKTYYYVIKETRLDKTTTGWTCDANEYHETVSVAFDGSGDLKATVTGDALPGALNFTNTYEATGVLSFKAQKTFTNGSYAAHPVTIKLTQVAGENSTASPTTGIVLTGEEKVVLQREGNPNEAEFNNVVTFHKNSGTDETGEYWFLLEEEVPDNLPADHIDTDTLIRYDANPRVWIKVKVTDLGNGQLKIEKIPAANTEGYDASFTNEQLGMLALKKDIIINDNATIPTTYNFYVRDGQGNYYDTDGTVSTSPIPISVKSDGMTLTIVKNLPLNVQFTVSEVTGTNNAAIAIEGYSVEVQSDNQVTTAVNDDQHPVMITNKYTRDTGKLKIRKTVSVNGSTTIASANMNLLDGDYIFLIQKTEDSAPEVTLRVKINITDGVVTDRATFVDVNGAAITVDDYTLSFENGEVIVSDLPTGKYKVTEELTTEQTGKGIRIAEKPETDITVGKYEDGVSAPASIPTAAFRNNKDIGDLEISKKLLKSSNREKIFKFEVVLKNGTAPVSGEFPATFVRNTPPSGPEDKVEFDADGKATILLHADEKVTIYQIPAGYSYTVKETDIPGGYTNTKPGGDATGNITAGKTSQAAFENTYNLASTKLVLGGTKTITGTSSTTQTFKFELFDTTDNTTGSGTNVDHFVVKDGQQPLSTASTNGATITSDSKGAKSFTFKEISYEAVESRDPSTDPSSQYPKTYYYVVRESAIDNNGWTNTQRELYRVAVTVTDEGNGKLKATPKFYDDNNTPIDDPQYTTSSLPFSNSYRATGNVTFSAKKIFKNGTMSNQQSFTIRLTQVKEDGSTEQATEHVVLSAPIEKTANSGSEQTVQFGVETSETMTFVKETGRDDTANTYWFLIEEVLPTLDVNGNNGGVKYETVSRKWIKVTLKDNEDGTLKVAKSGSESDTLDASFTNEQLGKLTLKKSVSVPQDRQARDSYIFYVKGADNLYYGKDTNGLTITSTNPIDIPVAPDNTGVTLEDLPIQAYTVTEVTGTDNDAIAIDGCSVEVTGNDTTETATKDGVTVTITNTYTRDTGSLRIRKLVTLNGADTTTSLVDGIYTFQVKSEDGLTTKSVTIRISGGKMTEVTGDGTPDDEGGTLYAKVTGLPTGKYTVTETISQDMTNKDIQPSSPASGSLEVTVVKDTATSIPPIASFTNNRNLGNLKITKEILGTDWGNLTDAQQQSILFTVKGPHNYTKTFTLADMDANHQYTLSDLMLGDYTVTETKAEWNAPKGFAFVSVAYSVQGGTTTVESGLTAEVMVTNTYTCSVQVQKTDVVTGKELPGAKIEIRDENGTLIDSWTSTTTPHVVTGLEVGKTYTLHEEVAPKGYTLTTDTCFTIDATGKVTGITEHPTPVRDDGVLLVEDSAEDTSAAVRKIWDDQNNRDGIRPVSITVSLQANGETVRTVTLSESNNWFAMEKNLPKMKDGKEITYTWKEGAISGYSLSGTVTKGILTTLTNTRTPEKTRVEVTKKWNDGGAQDRPNEIKVQLFGDGVACGTPVTLSEANGWHAVWTDIPAHTNPKGIAGGQRNIVYTVEEVSVPEGYTCRISGSQEAGFVITNTRNAGRLVIRKQFDVQDLETNPPEDIVWINLPVTKTWVDNNNADGNRPASITVHLWKGGKIIQTAELSAATGWAWTFGPLPKYNGENKPENEIAYSITEEPVPLYTSKVDGFHITNTLQDERTSVSVRKIWDDNNNEAGRRPLSILMTLSNGMSVILNEGNGWSATINDLPVRVGGRVVQYTWREQEVIGYVQSGREVNGSVTTFTNKPWTRGDMPEDAGTPRIPGDTWYIFEEYDTPLGVEVIINHVGDCFD